MYRFLWDNLPGNLAVKVVLTLLITLSILYLLFVIIFPWLELSFFAPPTVTG
jgi:hypothetical protein